nr:hypothetical protein [Pedobacter panaciterrae]
METIFDKSTVSGLIERIGLLSGESKSAWGEMDTFQMLGHCI